MKTYLALLWIVAICIPLAGAQTNIPGGPVSGVWTLAGSPYLIEGDISIAAGSELAIEAGCQVEFTDHYELRVFGRLAATGTETDPVVFGATDPAVGWNGIHFVDTDTNGQDPAVLSHCDFYYGRALGDVLAEQQGGAVNCANSSDVLISHCLFGENYADDAGGAIYLGPGCDIRVEWCDFLGNECYFSGGAIHCEGASPIMVNSLLQGNVSTFFASGIAAWYGADFHLENVKILDGEAGAVSGIYVVQSAPAVVNCLLAGNSSSLGAGGGLGVTSGGSVTVANTTIADNTAVQGGAGIWVNVSTVSVINSIVWGNAPDTFLLAGGGTAQVSYSDVEGGFTGEGNLNVNPDFTGTDPEFYALLESSQCIDAGNPDTTGLGLPEFDLAGNPRIANGIVDMGGYEAGGASDVPVPGGQPAQALWAQCAPNPFGRATTVAYELAHPAAVTLRICDVQGRLVRTLLDGAWQGARIHHAEWDGRDETGARVAAGTYLYVLRAGDQRATRRVTRF